MGTRNYCSRNCGEFENSTTHTKRWFKEDDKISIDICLLFVLFPRKNKLRRTHFYGVAKVNVDFIVLVKVSALRKFHTIQL